MLQSRLLLWSLTLLQTVFVLSAGLGFTGCETWIHPIADQLGSYSEGLARTEIRGKWGYVDPEGKLIIAPKFDYAWDFAEGLAAVRIGESWGFIYQRRIRDSTPF